MSASLQQIPFSNIPPNLRVPLFYAEFSTTGNAQSQPVQRALIIGQAIGSVVTAPTFIPGVAWAQQQYGIGSQLASRIAAYRANDPVGELWALPLADAGGAAAATGTIAFTGTATANGTLFLYIAGILVPVNVTVGMTATAAGIAVVAAVNAAATYLLPNTTVPVGLPVGAAQTTGTVTLHALNKGTLGNSIPIMLNYFGAQGGQTTPAGLTVTITAMSGGSGDPALTSIATWLGTAPFDFIENPYANQTALGVTTALMSDQTGRWSYSAQVYGHVFSADQDTVTNLLTLGGEFNDQHLTILGVNSASPSPAWLWGPATMGAAVPSLKVQPNQPLQTLAIAGVLPEPVGQDIGFSNQQSLLTAGIAVAARSAGGGAHIVRMVTTYQTNAYGQPDQSYLDTETLFTSMAVIRALKSAITQKFPRALLADDGTRVAPTPPGDTPLVVTPSVAKGELIAEYADLVGQNLCDNPAAFASGLIVQRNANDNSRMDVLFDPYYVSGLRVFAVLTQFHLQALQQAA